VLEADKLTAVCEPIVNTVWDPQQLKILWAFAVYYGDRFILSLSLEIIYSVLTGI
jgi:hypothetical protein